MARQKSFDEDQAIATFGRVFGARGYEKTSLDDLVAATGILRGSLYNSFGSKERMFILALEKALKEESGPIRDRLILIAFYELAPRSRKVRGMLQTLVRDWEGEAASRLGQILLTFSTVKEDSHEK